MTTIESPATEPVAEPNGVPIEKLRGTIAKLTDNPALAQVSTWSAPGLDAVRKGRHP